MKFKMVTALKLLPSDDLESQEKALAEITRAYAEAANDVDRIEQEMQTFYRMKSDEMTEAKERAAGLKARRELILEGTVEARRSGARIKGLTLGDGSRIYGIEECA